MTGDSNSEFVDADALEEIEMEFAPYAFRPLHSVSDDMFPYHVENDVLMHD